MTDRTADIQQLIPMPDRWEFHYLYLNRRGEQPKVCRVPMLGLALVSIPIIIQLGDETHNQDIVHFGPDGDDFRFMLYGSDSLDVFPFFRNDPHRRALGVAPIGSPDDWFSDLIPAATEQLSAERIYEKDEISLYRSLSKKMGKDFTHQSILDGFANFFRITTGSYRDQGVAKDWEKVLASLNEARTEGGDDAVIDALLSASKLSPLQVSEAEVAS